MDGWAFLVAGCFFLQGGGEGCGWGEEERRVDEGGERGTWMRAEDERRKQRKYRKKEKRSIWKPATEEMEEEKEKEQQQEYTWHSLIW